MKIQDNIHLISSANLNTPHPHPLDINSQVSFIYMQLLIHRKTRMFLIHKDIHQHRFLLIENEYRRMFSIQLIQS
jgi:hypothetical protein